MYKFVLAPTSRGLVAIMIATVLLSAIPSISHAQTTNQLNLNQASQLIGTISSLGGSNELLSAVSQVLQVMNSVQSLFGTLQQTIESKGPDEPCVGVIIYRWDTPNCKTIKAGRGGGGGGGLPGTELSGSLGDLNSVIQTISSVKGLIDQFKQLASGSSGGGAGEGLGTGSFNPALLDPRFGGQTSQIQNELNNAISGLNDLNTNLLNNNSVPYSQSDLSQLLDLANQVGSTANQINSSDVQITGNTSPTDYDSQAYKNSLIERINTIFGSLTPTSSEPNTDTSPTDNSNQNTTPNNQTNNNTGTTTSQNNTTDENGTSTDIATTNNEQVETTGYQFSLAEVENITAQYVDPDSRIADEEYYSYTVTLDTGEERQVDLPAFPPIDSQDTVDRLADIGYTGSAFAFLAAAEQEDIYYAVDDVESITVGELSPYSESEYEDYKEYTVTLNIGDSTVKLTNGTDEKVSFVVHTHADMTDTELESQFRSTGFVGEVNDLIENAQSTGTIDKVSLFRKIQNWVTDKAKSFVGFFRNRVNPNTYTDLPTSDRSIATGTATFKAKPASGDSPLTVEFEVSHPNTTLLFGDGESKTIDCKVQENKYEKTFSRRDIDEVVYSETNLPDNDIQRVYKIRLKNGQVHTARQYKHQDPEHFADLLAEIGYTGTDDDLRSMGKKVRGERFAKFTNYNNPNGVCIEPVKVSHTYTADGQYTAELFKGPLDNCGSVFPYNRCDRPENWLGGITIQVGDLVEETQKYLNVNPISGPSPLTVDIDTTFGDISEYRPSIADGFDTLIDFGDGSQPLWLQCLDGSDKDSCGFDTNEDSVLETTHTYNEDGVYQIKITQQGGFCAGACPVRELAQVMVVVGQPDSSLTTDPKFTANPAAGPSPLTVNFQSSYGWLWMPETSDQSGTLLDFGDGSPLTELNCPIPSQVKSCKSGSRLYPQGSAIQKIIDDNGQTVAETEGEFICRATQWTLEGRPVYPTYTGGQCLEPINIEHTYREDGNYMARIISTNKYCAENPSVLNQNEECQPQTISSQLISVGSQTSEENPDKEQDSPDTDIFDQSGTAYMEVTPTTGQAPLLVTLKGTYCEQAKFDFGDGLFASESTQAIDGSLCKDYSFNHNYSQPGTYTLNMNDKNGNLIDSVVINATGKANTTNQISFQAKVLNATNQALASNERLTSINTWTEGPIIIREDQDIALRWNADNYQDCLPFFADSSNYLLTRPGDTNLLSGNTEIEGYDIDEQSGQYRLECEGQANGEVGADIRTINVTILESAD